MDFGVDESWPDGIDPDPFFGNFLGESDGHGVNGGFRCGVIHILPWGTVLCRSRGKIDDGSALSSIFCGHPFHGLAGTEEGSCDVHCKDPLDPFGIHAIDTGLKVENSGIVDQSLGGS